MGNHGAYVVIPGPSIDKLTKLIAIAMPSQTQSVCLTLVFYWMYAEIPGRLDPPEETGGGILADEMGMGKSLSVLALILRTLEAAHQWSTQTDTSIQGTSSDWRSRSRSSATLIVASSDRKLNPIVSVTGSIEHRHSHDQRVVPGT
jgi:hypothetical protein